MGDLNRFQMRFIALRQQMIADGIRLGLPFHHKDLLYLSERSEKEGASFVQVTLPLLGRALDHCLVTGTFICPGNFAMKRNTCLPNLFYSLFTRIIGDDGNLRAEPCTITISHLRQLLLFDSKLISEPTIKQKQEAVQGFIDRQSILRKVRIPIDNPVLERASWLLGRVLRRLDLTTIHPGHGPGAVAEKKNREERWDFTDWPLKAERCYPYVIYGTPSIRASLERGVGVPLVKTMRTRCCLVPKDFRGPRLISAEPTVNQYLQQGQMKAIMQFVDKHKILSKSIKLRDQTHNQKLAQSAYDSGKATLDLSNASDTVSVALVWYLLKRVPKLRRQLMSTRSDFMVHEGRDIKITAFAPMGSATCFPVESLVFWALSIASLGHVRSLSGHPDELGVLSSEIAVFGDDIIIPDDALSTLVSVLRSVGCEPNVHKTCWLTPFRESCGTEWFRESDVTIIRNRRYHYEDDRKFSSQPVLLELQRKFFLRGFYSTAELLREWAREIYPVLTVPVSQYPLPLRWRRNALASDVVFLRGSHGHLRCKAIAEELQRRARDGFTSQTDQSFFERQLFAVDSYPVAIGWQFDSDIKLRVRFNRDYQRLEFRALHVFQDAVSWSTEGYSRLFARLSSDQSERFVHRNRKVKMAWSYFPGYISLSRDIPG